MLHAFSIPLMSTLAVGSVAASGFALPAAFEGLWNGGPLFTVLGPFAPSTYTFSISKSPAGDYLLENNIKYDGGDSGYQRFYLEGYGGTAGSLWYCGNLTHYFNGDGVTGDGRLNGFKNVSQTATSVTFCLDTENPAVKTGYENPFQPQCASCDCANWTFAYNAETDRLTTQLSMSGSEGHTHSKHLWAELDRVGAAPVIVDADMPRHGDEFGCAFEEGGRDSGPVTDQDVVGPVPRSSAGCPFLKWKQARDAERVAALMADADASTEYSHCYVLNQQTDFRLEWTVDEAAEALHCRVSAPAADENTYIAIGFRPASRMTDPKYIEMETGHHMSFGMEGADIVVGSGAKGLRSLYAELYTGPPIVDDSLHLSSAETKYDAESGRVVLSFTRPLVGGYLQTHYNVNVSIVSYDADIIWAIGSDESEGSDPNGSTCSYHDSTRGLRFVDWENPSIAMYDLWTC